MDTLVLKGMTFRGFHGFYDKEREIGNSFEVDVSIHHNFQKSAESDELADTIDYQLVYQAAESVMHGSSVKLIEHLALNIGKQLQINLPELQQFSVCVRKIQPPLNGEVLYSEITLKWPR